MNTPCLEIHPNINCSPGNFGREGKTCITLQFRSQTWIPGHISKLSFPLGLVGWNGCCELSDGRGLARCLASSGGAEVWWRVLTCCSLHSLPGSLNKTPHMEFTGEKKGCPCLSAAAPGVFSPKGEAQRTLVERKECSCFPFARIGAACGRFSTVLQVKIHPSYA